MKYLSQFVIFLFVLDGFGRLLIPSYFKQNPHWVTLLIVTITILLGVVTTHDLMQLPTKINKAPSAIANCVFWLVLSCYSLIAPLFVNYVVTNMQQDLNTIASSPPVPSNPILNYTDRLVQERLMAQAYRKCGISMCYKNKEGQLQIFSPTNEQKQQRQQHLKIQQQQLILEQYTSQQVRQNTFIVMLKLLGYFTASALTAGLLQYQKQIASK